MSHVERIKYLTETGNSCVEPWALPTATEWCYIGINRPVVTSSPWMAVYSWHACGIPPKLEFFLRGMPGVEYAGRGGGAQFSTPYTLRAVLPPEHIHVRDDVLMARMKVFLRLFTHMQTIPGKRGSHEHQPQHP